jgi:RNA polymerase sigma factor (sigma-70 family)
MTDYTDSKLLDMFHHGNKHYAYNLLVRKYQQRLYFHIRKIVIDHDDTNDILQNCLLKAWKGLDRFREESQLFTWLYRIATNEAITFLNKNRKRFLIPIVDVEHELSKQIEEDPLFSGDELEKKLHKAILTLPEKQRIIFNMRYFDEMKYEDISNILNTSVGALKASYHHAAKKIEKIMTSD